jgi:predicted dehydrogenase
MRLGLLSVARITDEAIVDPVRSPGGVTGVELTAVAARDPERARRAAAEWGIAHVLDTYDELATSEHVDAVYVATPAALHLPWALAAIDAGKHVLCEKPLTANAAEARQLVAAAERAGVVMMEAFHWRYHPIVGQIADAVARIGTIEHIDAEFDLVEGHIPRDDIRWELAIGGGALMDLGCYPLQWVRYVAQLDRPGIEPTVTAAEAVCPVEQVDASLRAELAWPDGPTATIHCSMIASEARVGLRIRGTAGRVDVVNPLAPQRGASLTISTDAGTELIAVSTSTTYSHQLAAFRDAVVDGTPYPTGGADSIATMTLIDACYEAAGLRPRPSLA